MGFIFIGIAILAFVLLRFTVFGEDVLVTGNAVATRLSGMPRRRILTIVFAISGGLAAFSGAILTSRLRIAQPTNKWIDNR